MRATGQRRRVSRFLAAYGREPRTSPTRPRRAADLLWLQFGEWREVPSRKGGTRRVGEWGLHVQTPWRFTRGSRIIVGNRDLYYYAESSDDFAEGHREFDWDKDGESRFDRHAAVLNGEFADAPP
jgi:hypothetical protein